MLIKLLKPGNSINSDYMINLYVMPNSEEVENPETKEKELKILPGHQVVARMIDGTLLSLYQDDDLIKVQAEYDRIINRANKGRY
jgi:hypothetical protein